jgi:CRP-like cAMP-binding protein/1-acyl-sn-glycerol-3-phosphate acyltransferase
MNILPALKQLPCWTGVAIPALEVLFNAAELVQIEAGSIITEQFKSASDFYLLCDGTVDHYVTLLNGQQQALAVGRLDTAWCAIGWSGLIAPHRYATQARCSSQATLLRWNYDILKNLATSHPEAFRALLALILDSSKTLLECSRSMLKPLPAPAMPKGEITQSAPLQFKHKLTSHIAIKHLRSSTLFQDATLYELSYLAKHVRLEQYAKGSIIYKESELAVDVLVLVKGTVNLYYQTDLAATNSEDAPGMFLRSLSQPGQTISWTPLTQSQRHEISAIADADVMLCCIPASIILHYCEDRTEFAINLHKNLLQIIASHLRATRALLIKQHTRNEQTTISCLFHSLGPHLANNSPLHKVPLLLRNPITREDAFYYLERMNREGCQLEKNVAGLCLDLLKETRREFEFYQGLQSIYRMVVNAHDEEDPRRIRNKSAAEFTRVFENTRYLIHGQQNLPHGTGHIYILNHLVSHPCHTLPNGFEFALDTHFVSSMILYKHYGDSGIRVVRKNRDVEYGHESYYQRLGHIHVYTNKSQPATDDNSSSNRRDRFFNEATQYLQQGNNIIICPEGTTHLSAESPGHFKSGAFRLAAMQNRETFIVPIVVANFDKQICETVLTAVIKPPFRIGDVIDPSDPGALDTFLTKLRANYKLYIKEAQRLSENYHTNDTGP